MIRLLAVVQTRPNQLLPSVQTDWCCTDSGPLEPKIIMTLLPARLLLPMPSPENVPFWEGSTPEEGTPRVSGEPSRRKGSAHTSPEGRGLRFLAVPRPRSTLPTSTRSFVSRRHKSRGDPRYRTRLPCGQSNAREASQRSGVKSMLRSIYVDMT